MTATTSGSSSKGFVLIVAAIIVLGLGGVAFLATQRDSAINSDIEPTAAVEVSGDPVEAMPQNISVTSADTDPAVGHAVPDIVGTDFDGNEVSITADGHPKAVYFIAHWCPHCQQEVPRVQALIDEGKVPEGVELYAVSTAVDQAKGNFPPYLWLDRENFTVPTIRDDAASSAYTAFGAGGFPYVVYLDGDNNVVSRSSGELTPDVIATMWQQLALAGSDEGAADEGATDDGGDGGD